MSLNESDSDERTIFVGNLSEKTTNDLLAELFLQAGPLERVSIPKEKDGKNKSFGFVTYKHLAAVSYALSIFSGTKLFGRELMLKNRNSNNRNHNTSDNFSTSRNVNNTLISGGAVNPLLNAINFDASMSPSMNLNMPMAVPMTLEQQMLGQQLIQFAMYNQSNFEPFPSQRNDHIGSQRDRDFVDRSRHHREEERSRNKPYRRSRSRSPPNRRSPPSYGGNRPRSPNNRRDRDRRREGDDRGYHRWNYRK